MARSAYRGFSVHKILFLVKNNSVYQGKNKKGINHMSKSILFDNGGRRSGEERRQPAGVNPSTDHRTGKERRNGADRRKTPRYAVNEP
jgi:hypothetical protein